MTIAYISPKETADEIQNGKAVLIDVRTVGEVQQSYIANSIFIPHEILTKERLDKIGVTDKKLIFLCHSGNRAETVAKRIAAEIPEISVLEGGIESWKKQGLDVTKGCNTAIPMERQVLIGAGSMILASLGLAQTVSMSFLWWATFVGAGMVFAGITGFCGMAKVLALMPWNKKSATPDCCSR